MVEIRNVVKEKLAANELAIGVGLRQSRTVDIGKAMKTAGFDWLFIDMEHNSMDIDTAVQISVAAQDAGITPIVLPPSEMAPSAREPMSPVLPAPKTTGAPRRASRRPNSCAASL